jgi:hypothetical protein
MNIREGDKPWRDHLMGVDGCVKNSRRLQALKTSNLNNNEHKKCLYFVR